MAKLEMPNLDNATPEFIIDESAKFAMVENYSKKMRKFYREALFSRLKIDPSQKVEDRQEPGATFMTSIKQFPSKRFDTERFKTEHPDLYDQFLKSSDTTRMTFALKEGVINPKVADIMKELFGELGLEPAEPE